MEEVNVGLSLWAIIAIGVVVLTVVVLIVAMAFRRVVEAGEGHLVMSNKKTIAYGANEDAGNVYYEWPTSWPKLGVTKRVLSIENFEVPLNRYEAYDKDKVPFTVDVASFFRISDMAIAAQRIKDIPALKRQLENIVQGTVRSVLASYDIDEIMTQRSIFGDEFTKALKAELPQWGVVTIKNLELMNIEDSNSEGGAISDIMAKKQSAISKDSRIEVANNNKEAELSEITAQQEVDVRDQDAEKAVGERTAEKEKAVGIAKEQSLQEIKEAQAVTATKEMAVQRVNDVKAAEIEVDVATQNKEKADIDAAAALVTGEAAAKVKELIFKADNALEIRLEMQKDTSIGVAKALADSGSELVPRIVIGGGDNESGSSDPTVVLQQLMSVGIASQLANANKVAEKLTDEVTKSVAGVTAE